MPEFTRRTFFALSGAALPVAHAAPQTSLAGAFPPDRLAGVLLAPGQWKPFPTDWNGLPDAMKQALVAAGERNLGRQWPVLPATVFLEYVRTGNRSHYERIRNERRDALRELVVAECAEAKGRFLDDIVNGTWATCEESFWGVPAHLGLQKSRAGLPDPAEPVVDLFAAETASLLAWTVYLLGPRLDKLNPMLRQRIDFEMERRILTPNLERDDFWWMGLRGGREVNNWNPWINSNWLTAALLLERDPKRRVAAVYKSMRSLDRFLAGYAPDGGCDEGPGYWGRAGASLFDCLELLHSASNGAIDFYRVPLVGEIGRYIYRAHIADEWFINFADASARIHPAGDLIYRYGKRIGDETMQAFGAWAADGRNAARGESIGRQLPAIFGASEVASAPKRQAYIGEAWMPGIQVMAARAQAGSPRGLYLAAQGGHNAESHNHNDVGNFIVYSDGKPAIIDVGVETYSAKTFSSQRYEIWTMQSAFHNCPTIGGVMQSAGREFAASDVSYRDGEFRLNIARAYPKEAGLRSWNRVLRLDRSANQVVLSDSYALDKSAPEITLTLMTHPKPSVAGPGVVELAGGPAILHDRALTASVEEIKLEDARLRSSWGEKVYRILLKASNPPQSGEWKTTIK